MLLPTKELNKYIKCLSDRPIKFGTTISISLFVMLLLLKHQHFDHCVCALHKNFYHKYSMLCLLSWQAVTDTLTPFNLQVYYPATEDCPQHSSGPSLRMQLCSLSTSIPKSSYAVRWSWIQHREVCSKGNVAYGHVPAAMH